VGYGIWLATVSVVLPGWLSFEGPARRSLQAAADARIAGWPAWLEEHIRLLLGNTEVDAAGFELFFVDLRTRVPGHRPREAVSRAGHLIGPQHTLRLGTIRERSGSCSSCHGEGNIDVAKGSVIVHVAPSITRSLRNAAS
jgi:hypothetical protein